MGTRSTGIELFSVLRAGTTQIDRLFHRLHGLWVGIGLTWGVRLGICRLRRHVPSSAGHHDQSKSAVLLRRIAVFRTAPPLTKASFRRSDTARKKRPTFVERFCFGRDSVGIRTQDPQLRRLLLYPTELPNRSLFCVRCYESGCKDMLFL